MPLFADPIPRRFDPAWTPRARRLPRAFSTPPRLPDTSGAPRIVRGRVLLVSPFYPKDPHASFGKHVLTPTLALLGLM